MASLRFALWPAIDQGVDITTAMRCNQGELRVDLATLTGAKKAFPDGMLGNAKTLEGQ